jgi:hypothetical protein
MRAAADRQQERGATRTLLERKLAKLQSSIPEPARPRRPWLSGLLRP